MHGRGEGIRDEINIAEVNQVKRRERVQQHRFSHHAVLVVEELSCHPARWLKDCSWTLPTLDAADLYNIYLTIYSRVN